MIAGTIWKQLVTTLEQNPALSKYIKHVFEGERIDKLEPSVLPCIMLEPVKKNKTSRLNNVDKVSLEINLFAFSSNNYTDFVKTIVGDSNYKGILDIDNDICACLGSSNTLGGIVIDIETGDSDFAVLEDAKYPVRGMILPIRVLYQQQDGI